MPRGTTHRIDAELLWPAMLALRNLASFPTLPFVATVVVPAFLARRSGAAIRFPADNALAILAVGFLAATGREGLDDHPDLTAAQAFFGDVFEEGDHVQQLHFVHKASLT